MLNKPYTDELNDFKNTHMIIKG